MNKKLEIEFRKKKKSDYEYVIVNKIPDLNSYVLDRGKKDPYLYIYNEDVFNILKNFSPNELIQHFIKLTFRGIAVDWFDYHIEFIITFKEIKYRNDYSDYPSIILSFQPDVENWAKLWSLTEYFEMIKKTLLEIEFNEFGYYQEDDELLLNGIGIKLKRLNLNTPIGTSIENILDAFKKINEEAIYKLNNKLDENSLIETFEFPLEVKSACKQYLIYFAQFLADLGIYADTEIKEEANKTLFKVTPNDKGEALGNIRKILDSYLQMAGSNETQLMQMNGDIAVLQLKSNISHLQSQLALGQAVLQMKDASIQAKDAAIEALQLSNYQLKEKSKTLEDKASKKEDIIPGIVSVKEYDGKGFSINLAEITKRLKRVVSDKFKR